MYKIGYIKGYDAFNTMHFADLSSQQAFFNNHTTITIDAYYPPHYTNVISVDSTQVPLTQQYNFVIIISNSRYYYYFINSIEYINEDLYNIHIEMDTVQTFMFYATIESAVQTRDSIKRWIGNKINRDYIRENVSKGDFFEYEQGYFNVDKWVIILSTKDYVTTGGFKCNTKLANGEVIPQGYYIYIAPLIERNDINNYVAIDIDGEVTDLAGTNVTPMTSSVINQLIDEITPILTSHANALKELMGILNRNRDDNLTK